MRLFLIKKIDLRYVAIRFVRCVCIAWLIVFAGMYAAQRQLLYLPFGQLAQPHERGLPHVVASTLPTTGGAHVATWYGAAKPGKPTILYFHGQGGVLSHYAFAFRRFAAEGWGLMAVTYRGYAGSTGSPSEAANVADAVTAYDALRAKGVAASDIVVYGFSLGTGVAAQLAAQRLVAAVVLEAPYSSVTDIAAERFWYLPVRWALSDTYDTVAHIQKVRAPVLILHGALDAVIPVKFSRRLADATPGPKRFVEFPGGRHTDLHNHGAFDAVRAWVARHHGVPPQAS
jgi:uncharacterized protein